MPSSILNSDDGVISGTSGLKSSGGDDGVLEFQNNGTAQAKITAAGLMQFNSGYGSVATAYGCRAWVNFNGTGTVAIRASGNVSSITDNGTGEYTVNFTTAMPDVNYVIIGSSAVDNVANRNLRGINTIGPYNTGSIKINTINSTIGSEDQQFINVAIFR